MARRPCNSGNSTIKPVAQFQEHDGQDWMNASKSLLIVKGPEGTAR
jgi:hypothetical protein